ncbi:MAG: Endoribonuclease EndoA [Mycoplasmataceae bacterium]|nr:MAG: Endoribonuclease EndoA [Mycoplasmataceae bacterium]
MNEKALMKKMKMINEINYGNVYWVNFSQDDIESDILKLRPALVISSNKFNRISNRAFVISFITNIENPYPWNCPIIFKKKPCKIKCDQMKSIDKKRFMKIIDTLLELTLMKVEKKVKFVIHLNK